MARLYQGVHSLEGGMSVVQQYDTRLKAMQFRGTPNQYTTLFFRRSPVSYYELSWHTRTSFEAKAGILALSQTLIGPHVYDEYAGGTVGTATLPLNETFHQGFDPDVPLGKRLASASGKTGLRWRPHPDYDDRDLITISSQDNELAIDSDLISVLHWTTIVPECSKDESIRALENMHILYEHGVLHYEAELALRALAARS